MLLVRRITLLFLLTAFNSVRLSSPTNPGIFSIKFDKNLTNKALGSRWRIYSKSTLGFGPCASWCLTVSRCRSINYCRTTMKCDLNAINSTEADGDLSEAKGCVLVDRNPLPKSMSPCVNTCTKDQHCIPGSDKTGNTICEPDCVATPPTNGIVSKKVLRHGESVEYACNQGYVSAGPISRRCEAGTLQGSQPLCGKCPQGYFLYKDGSFCFVLRNVCCNWQAARDACRSDGGDLLVLNDPKLDLKYMQEVLKTLPIAECARRVWIGAFKSNRVWMWLNKETLSSRDRFWLPREPNRKGECATLMVQTFQGDAIFCSSNASFACQFYL